MTPESKVNILMVDDQPAKLLSYEVILAEIGENLIRASSAQEALQVLLREDIAVVLTDVNMPGLDGFGLTNMMRAHPRLRTTAVIFVSAIHLTDSDRINAYRIGVVDYISVPVIPEILRAKVSVFVDLHRKTRLLEQLNAQLEARVQERTEELRQSEEHHRARSEELARFFEATNDGILILNPDYEVMSLNRRGQELLASVATIAGRTLFEDLFSALHQHSSFLENFSHTMNTGEPRHFEIFYPAPLNIWFRIQSYRSGQGLVVFFRDFTEEKLAHEELRRKTEEAERQHAEIESVYKTAPIGLALYDAKTFRYLRLNDRESAFFGLTPEQVVGRTLTEMVSIDGLRELFEQVRRGEPVVNYPIEGTLISDPDDYRYWLVSYFPLYGPDGKVDAITAASVEVTAQKRAEKALIDSEKLAAVGRLASSIAHEINNPLEAVTNLLYLARESCEFDTAKEYIRTAESELRRVSAIASQTLRFHRQATAPVEVIPKDLIENVLSIYQGRISSSAVRIRERAQAEISVRCFEGEIRQVLSNLISNALDAMSHVGGFLYLRTSKGKNWSTTQLGVVITVADTGTGMSHQTLSKLFDPFFTTKGQTGTGLGLWVTKQIVDRHRGALSVRSSQSTAHHGTVFRLFLPSDAAVRKN